MKTSSSMIGILVHIFIITVICQKSICETVSKPPESPISLPEVFTKSHWKHQFLDIQTAKERLINKESCISLGSILTKQNIYVSVPVPQGATVVLPCIYCGAYERQEKYWFRANFTWNIKWDKHDNTSTFEYYRRRFIMTMQETVSGQPDKLYRVVQRKDNALVISDFSDEDTGIFSCNHNFTFDMQKGRMTYILDVISKHPHITQGGSFKFLQYKCNISSLNINDYSLEKSFFNNTQFEVQLVAQGRCEGMCKGEPGYESKYFSPYLVHRDSVPPGRYHQSLMLFSSGIHVRSSYLKKLDSTLANKFQEVDDFFFFAPCNTEEVCPDPFAKPLPSVVSAIEEKLPSTTKEAQSIVAENMESLSKNRFELRYAGSRVLHKFKLDCFLEIDEEPVWFHTDLQNITKEIGKSLWSMLREQTANVINVTEDYKLDIGSKLKEHNAPFTFDYIGEGHVGNYLCYGKKVGTNILRKRKEYFILAKSVQGHMTDFIVKNTEDYFAYTLIFFVASLLFFNIRG
ncbi:uncharacterized protein LOC135200815 isoform X2 [Macrobrachium nipponense]|uniref:uncharacterized protein LOC135200815 isoform X2 n=1 Tax=Macrobrachium nipponense TaxID=159736 RepID=UPI0030C825F0